MSRAITTAVSSIMLAQGLKIPFEYLQTGKWNVKTAVTPGGMPSSHSAGVSSLATYIGLKKGFTSIDFSIATLLGLIVMYDAAGVRYHAGQTAIAVNGLKESVEKLSESHPEIAPYHNREKELKERLGHLPSEVAAGALFGIAMGALSFLFSKR
ncbi:divergent PAP2 family protein [Ammoniphilus sp. CFH 90114]|uniref:divergent PAP2 family protein n=1 Tax=Ammoniphilus sp. CFH 90114 TaxID=2493665 RepID=UPI00100F9E2C|nr:divergent PAP2 family protein [Ammoniphilus sp. CFH 90114]RXT14821.1 divergent PAP2 family protein [Ammoniphilus sp. CFH 90114]